VKLVWEKIRTDGLAPTIESVMNKLDQPLPLGYCNVGVVEQVGAGVTGFSVGERVASNGKHAEVVCVPAILCAKVPDGVSDDDAAFTVLSSIALQGIRLAQPTLGETFAVIGLGLIGLVTAQLLRANGCKVIGIDFDETKLAAARAMGADTVNRGAGQDPVAFADTFTAGRGVDAVIITAATDSPEPVQSAARMSRKRGRIVSVTTTPTRSAATTTPPASCDGPSSATMPPGNSSRITAPPVAVTSGWRWNLETAPSGAGPAQS